MQFLTEHFGDLAETIHIEGETTLFYQGDTPQYLYQLIAGSCSVYVDSRLQREVTASAWLDEIASLGGLPHTQKVVAENAKFRRWPLATLRDAPRFHAEAQQFLARELLHTQEGYHALAAPLQYQEPSAELLPGPFHFDETTMIFLFCEADKDAVQHLLPANLSLLQRPLKKTAPVLIALADFPKAYRLHRPEAVFRYNEATFFVPIRFKNAFGFFVPYIYPSTWEPTLLGREIYGFPKRLGHTHFEPRRAELTFPHHRLELSWEGGQGADETRLVRALSDWLGIEGRLASAAFSAGELLRNMTRLPAHRRVDVYNRKRIFAADTQHDDPRYDVDVLTRATFGVTQWYQIAVLSELQLSDSGEVFDQLNLSLSEGFRTQLDMRLSTGRTVHDYRG